MKKFILIGITVGIASLAQASSITILPTGSQITGTKSYIYQESIAIGTLISSASISFSSITLTASGSLPNTLFYDLINGNYGTKTISSGETSYDYFQNTSPYNGKGISDSLGSKTFAAPVPIYNSRHQITGYTYDTESWTYTFTGLALTDLQNDILNKGYFDIGLDPNCTYVINGSIVLNYTTTTSGNGNGVPDQGMTASLLGMSFLGLLVFRRKLAFN